MNKIFRFPAAVAAITIGATSLFTSCKERSEIFVDTGSVDTTFTAPVETPQQRNVLMEEVTGVTCPNCPAGHVVIAKLVDSFMNTATHQSRVKAIGVQKFGFKQCEPMEGGLTQHDNRTQVGTTLIDNIYGAVPSAPAAGIDRTLNGGSMFSTPNFWPSSVYSRLAIATKVNVTVTSSYSATTKIATIKVHTAYTQDVSKKQVLTVAIIEDSIVDGQENGGDKIAAYNHEHVLRDILTLPVGSPVIDSITNKQAGRVYERTFKYDLSTIPANWVPQNCHIIAYISDAETGDKEVQQSAEAKLQ